MTLFRLLKTRKTCWAAVLWVGLVSSQSVFAVTTLKSLQVDQGNQVQLFFDGKIDQAQIQTEFVNDIVQLSMNNTVVYPAKMTSVKDGLITKIFAYQYSPKLVRCRISVKGKAEDLRNNIQLVVDGKTVRVKISNEIREIKQPAEIEVDEKQLMDRVLAIKPVSAPIQKVDSAEKQPEKQLEKPSEGLSEKSHEKSSEKLAEKNTLTAGKPLPSIWGVFFKLSGVLAFFGLLAFLLKKFRNPELKNSDSSGWMKQIAKFASRGLMKDPRMIQVVSTQYLGPKKSIVVVRIAERLLVLGVSNDSINLITQISDGREDEDTHDFAALLKSEKMPIDEEISESSKPMTPVVGVRSRIKNRLEGLKPL